MFSKNNGAIRSQTYENLPSNSRFLATVPILGQPPRYPGVLHHVIGRRIERHKIFTDDIDRNDCVQRQRLGLTTQGFIAVDDVLSLFVKKTRTVRKNYAAFVADGIDQGPRPELVGGGLRRSQAGSLQHSAISVDE